MRPLVLVTGGAGFIGSHTVALLLERGYAVRVLDVLVPQVHNGAGPRHVSPEAEFIQGDVRDVEALRRALRGARRVIHLAAEVGVGQSMYEISRYVDANAGGTARLLEELAARHHQVEKLVVASSMTVYGEGAYHCLEHGLLFPPPREREQLARREWEPRCPACARPLEPRPTAESAPPRPGSIYAISKLSQELMALTFGRAYGVPVVALRYFNTYGPRQALANPYAGIGALFCARLLSRQPPLVYEDGRQVRDFVHVHDVARATVLALESERASGQVVNVGSGEPRPVLEVARMLARCLGIWIEPRVVGLSRAGDVRHCYADLSRARALLGYQPRMRFEDGMAELAAWAAEQGPVRDPLVASLELAQRGLAW